VIASPGFDTADGSESSRPIVVEGQPVGTALVRSTGSGLTAADRSLPTALLRAIAGAAGLAALLALLTGLAVARRITRPVIRLIEATRAMAAGDRAARVGEIHAPGELRELAAAFDQMAGTLDRQEQIRRNLVGNGGRRAGPGVRGGGQRPGPGTRRELGAGGPALAAPGDHEPAHQRAEVHPVRRPRHDQHRTVRLLRGPARYRPRCRDRRRRPA